MYFLALNFLCKLKLWKGKGIQQDIWKLDEPEGNLDISTSNMTNVFFVKKYVNIKKEGVSLIKFSQCPNFTLPYHTYDKR